MDVGDAIAALGGPSAVGAAVGEKPKTVGMWGARNRVPGDRLLAFWQLCLRSGVAWEPPGADAIRAQLGASPPAKAA
jgi:hypothetical protein